MKNHVVSIYSNLFRTFCAEFNLSSVRLSFCDFIQRFRKQTAQPKNLCYIDNKNRNGVDTKQINRNKNGTRKEKHAATKILINLIEKE